MSTTLQILGTEDLTGAYNFRATVTNEDGREVTKVLGYEQICKFLQSSYREAEVPSLSVGKIPPNYLDAKIDANGNGLVRVLIMGAVRPFLQAVLNKKIPKQWDIPYPSMIFEVGYGKKITPYGHAYCVKGTEQEIRDAYYSSKGVEIFQYPFGNINSSGGMCMGNIRVKVPEMSDVGIFLDAFWSGITNNDYLNGDRANVNVKLSQTELLMSIEGKEKFPEEYLIPSPSKRLTMFH